VFLVLKGHNIMMKHLFKFLLLLFISIALTSCLFTSDNDDDDVIVTDDSTDSIDISTVVSALYATNSTVTVGTTTITISAVGVPNHGSPYFEQTDSRWEAWDGDYDSSNQNPNVIGTQNFTFVIPRYPEEADSKEATPYGPMGVASNSVSFYNQNAAPGDDLSQEILTFDQYYGHPTNTSSYHYHIEPLYLTSSNAESLLGFLLDGFPVYGPEEDGVAVTDSDLDDYHGHTGTTEDFPDGIYHYHITDDYPYINGDGFYGTSGTVSQ
jgi:hypothetical protein